MQNKNGENINYISILPFFGHDIQQAGSLISNIKITSIKLFDEKNNKTFELVGKKPVYIASDISKKTIDNYENFFYNKGVFKFDERKVNKVYITFEQDSFNDVLIKHAYWTPYELRKRKKMEQSITIRTRICSWYCK